MSTIIIEIETDSPAFHDEDGNPNPGPELGRILHELADGVEIDGPQARSLPDISGVQVGRIEVVEGKIPTRDQLNDWLDVAERALGEIREARFYAYPSQTAGQALCILRNRHDLYGKVEPPEGQMCEACAEEGRDRPATGYFDKPDPETGFTHLCDEHIREHDNRHGG